MRGEPGFRRSCLRTLELANARRDAARRAGVTDHPRSAEGNTRSSFRLPPSSFGRSRPVTSSAHLKEGAIGKFVKVATNSEIADQSAKLLEIGDKSIALFNLGGQFYAIDDTCPHNGGPLCEGPIEGDEVECPWHGSRFNIKTGKVTTPPAEEGVATYIVRVTGEDIEIEV